ncbi:MAG: hypothetical protein B6I36_01925 [Desulfobacteraceae bacterium 4572_35.1]|nr:MAG: hypothetical protein B6I36_01925 [Desulfobacteraceae bacterium 4572_35.1]
MLSKLLAQNSWVFVGTAQESVEFCSIEKILDLDGEIVSSDKISLVRKVVNDGRVYYVKIYYRNGNGLRHYLGRGRLQGEWENLFFFENIGIRIPRIVAYGQRTKYFQFRFGVLVTAEVPDSADLLTISQKNSTLLQDKIWRDSVMAQIAQFTRILHCHGFVHWDLKWRNILVSNYTTQQPLVCFFDCPLGRQRFGWLRRRGAIKDIACLDKVAKKVLSRSLRLKFYKEYVQCDKINCHIKKQVYKIVKFFNS